MLELSRLFALGLQHPLAAPDHLLLLLACGVLAGQQGWRSALWAVGGFFLLLVFTLWLTYFKYLPLLSEWTQPMIILLSLSAATALLITLRLVLPIGLLCLLLLGAALLLGLDLEVPRILGVSRARSGEFIWGAVLSNGAIMTVSALLAVALRSVLSGLILRVAGAWLAAAALLVLTLQLSQLASV